MSYHLGASFAAVLAAVACTTGQLARFCPPHPTFVPDHFRIRADTSAPGSIRGYLLSLPDSVRLPNAIVRIPSRRAGTYADSAGRFQLVGLAPGKILLEFRHIGYYSADVPIEIPNTYGLFIDGALERDCTMPL